MGDFCISIWSCLVCLQVLSGVVRRYNVVLQNRPARLHAVHYCDMQHCSTGDVTLYWLVVWAQSVLRNFQDSALRWV